MRYVKGDLFETDLKVIGHGVNLRGIMGGGVAAEIKRRYPRVFETYQQICLFKPEEFRLGDVLPASQTRNDPIIFNMATQDLPGADARYNAITNAAFSALALAKSLDVPEIAIPKIGTGIGELEWEVIEECLLVAEHFNDSQFVVYIK